MNPAQFISLSDIPDTDTGYRLEAFDGELVLYHGTATQVIYLNETAALVWRLCDGQRTVETICDLLKESYPDTANQIEHDVIDALAELVQAGALILR
jgi:coenzyme PQQ biosynthesis protein PqqD